MRDGDSSMSADCRSRAATKASSFDSSSRPTFSHRMFAAFGDQELGRDQFRSLAKPQGLRRPVFVDNPSDRDAGVNDECLYPFEAWRLSPAGLRRPPPGSPRPAPRQGKAGRR